MHCILRLITVLLGGLITFSLSVEAQPAPDYRPGIIGEDDRRIIDSWDHPWNAIGHVNVSGYRMRSACTGTLIAPRLVLTASHCLVDPLKRKPYPMHDIHFVAGVRRDKILEHSIAKCLRFPKKNRHAGPDKLFPTPPSQSVSIESFNLDIGIIVLTEPLTIDPIVLAKGMKFREGLPLVHAAYAADRRFILSGDFTCRLISHKDGLWGTSCDTHGGSSGGPILVKQGEEYRLAAVMVGSLQRLMTFAVPISVWDDLSLDEDCP